MELSFWAIRKTKLSVKLQLVVKTDVFKNKLVKDQSDDKIFIVCNSKITI